MRSGVPVLDGTAVRYVAVGLANTLVGLVVIYIVMYALGLGNASANIIGYAVGLGFSFALNKRWTFSHDGDTPGAFIRFLIVVLLAYFANLATVMFTAEVLGWNRYVAQALGIGPYTVIGYVGSRLYAFRPAMSSPSEPPRHTP